MKHCGLISLALALFGALACNKEPVARRANDAEGGAAACAHGTGGAGAPTTAIATDAQQAILSAFDEYQLVGGMNASHGDKAVDDFILSLLQNPAFPDTVNDIAVECGNSLYQDVLDRYTAGEEVPLAQVQAVWRNTTQIECGFSSFNEQLFPLLRRINQRLAPEKRLRILACDPPVDWQQVDSMDDLAPFRDRDASIAAVIEKEVLVKHRKALLLFGIHHLLHGSESAVGRYEAAGYPNRTFVIANHVGFGNDTPLTQRNDELEARMADWRVPSLVSLEATWLSDLDPAYFNEEPQFPGQLGFPGVDGYLFVGRRDSLLREPRAPRALLDQDYLRELRQRADRLGAPADAPRRPENLIQLESQASVFNYAPP